MSELRDEVRTDLASRTSSLRSRKKLDAVVEASRAGVLVAVPRLRPVHDALMQSRGEDAPRPPAGFGRPREILAVLGLLLALVVPGLALPSPRNGRTALDIDVAALWVGIVAALALAVFAVLERGRRDSRFLGPQTKSAPRLYLIIAVVWTLVLVFLIANAGEIDRYEPALPILGGVLLVLSILGMAALSFVARRRDALWRADPEIAAMDVWGRSAAHVDPAEAWWAGLPTRLTPPERGAADRSYVAVLETLEQQGIITAADGRRLRRKRPPIVWAGDAG